MVVYFNPACSKCQEALAAMDQHSCSYVLRNYLIDSPSVAELKELLALLGCGVMDIVRQKEKLFETLSDNKYLGEDDWLEALSKYPELIERPIIIDGLRATIGRPVSKVIDFVQKRP